MVSNLIRHLTAHPQYNLTGWGHYVYILAMKSTYSVSKAQNRFPHLLREAAKSGAIVITRHDETVAYVVGRERMEAIVETMDVLSNPMAMKAIRDYEKGSTSFSLLDVLDDKD